jgi:3D (Asp-Asp-Asp) domain-containing protein
MRIYSAAPMVALASLFLVWGIGLRPREEDQQARLPLIVVVADGRQHQTRSSAATVGEVLAELGISLGPLDRTSPAPATPVRDGLPVRVTRVAKRTQVEELLVPARTVVLAVPERAAGHSQVLAEGQDGRLLREVRVWEKDGQVTARTVLREEVLVPAKDRVVMRGTEGTPSRGGDWRRALHMTATAYDPGPRSCGKHADGYTATGARAQRGVVATDPRVIPMGTRLYIPGYGFAVAADRGSAIKGARIDLCFDTYREAKQFGRRQVDVYLLR